MTRYILKETLYAVMKTVEFSDGMILTESQLNIRDKCCVIFYVGEIFSKTENRFVACNGRGSLQLDPSLFDKVEIG